MTETVCPTKTKILIVWPFTEKNLPIPVAEQWLLPGSEYAPQETFGNFWRHFWLLKLGKALPSYSWKTSRILLNRLQCRGAPQNKDLCAPKC